MIGLALAAGGGLIAALASWRSSHYSPSLQAVVMPRRSILIFAATLLILMAGAAAVLAYDSSQRNLIADGITVGGIDIGGLSASHARARLRAAPSTSLG